MEQNEINFVKEIKKFLEDEAGCTCWTEVKPDNSRLRIDLIFYRNDIGYIAVESKYLNTLRQGTICAEALEQMKKYKELTFFGGKIITRWCFAPFFSTHTLDNEPKSVLEVTFFVRNFFKFYGLSFLEFKKHNNSIWDNIVLDYGLPSAIYFKRGDKKHGTGTD